MSFDRSAVDMDKQIAIWAKNNTVLQVTLWLPDGPEPHQGSIELYQGVIEYILPMHVVMRTQDARTIAFPKYDFSVGRWYQIDVLKETGDAETA
jgi:hypothetical protein